MPGPLLGLTESAGLLAARACGPGRTPSTLYLSRPRGPSQALRGRAREDGAPSAEIKAEVPSPARSAAPLPGSHTSSFVTMFFNPVKQTVQLEPGPPASIFADV